ncbi:MAG: DUF488 domain-containing protein [Anaerolineae bacterium]|nr:DUF488 domain-containing protein [Anaerolineae bacterium]
MTTPLDFQVKRVYEPADAGDGFRVLVDRLWPRGVSKDRAHLDLWLKDIAPSTELRTWFGHDPAKWDEFRARYFRELGEHQGDIDTLLEKARQGRVTLLYGARETEHNDAVALHEYLMAHPATH